MKASARISESEWEIMNLVWAKSPLSTSEIVEQLSAKVGWHSRTIRTLLDRLVRKGALAYVTEGKRYLYRPQVSMEECVRKESQSFLERAFGGEPASMLIHLVKTTRLSPAEIQQLKAILAEKER